jgi:multicomponent Na+:H+ antiporter subunit B
MPPDETTPGAGDPRPSTPAREAGGGGESLIFTTATKYLLPLLLLFSLFLLLRGHNEPGGGFVAGLVAASALALHALAHGSQATRALMQADPIQLIGVGLFLAAGSGVLPLLEGLPLLTSLWSAQEIPVLGKIGTPLVFDAGVCLVVTGAMLAIILTLTED